MAYKPNPKDTSKIKVPAELKELTERLAENTHEVWAKKKTEQGWKYGPESSDARKEHPDLVPYEKLPEQIKDYDRNTAMETVKLLLSLGYRIESPHKSAAASSAPTSAEGESARLRALPRNAQLSELLSFWNGRDREVWCHAVELYRQMGSRFLRAGEPLLAYDVTKEGLLSSGGDVRLRQLQAMALARSQVAEEAYAIASKLYNEGERDEETLGIRARYHKDLAEAATDPQKKQEHLRSAFEAYADAFRLKGAYWHGINAATLAFLLGEREAAGRIAREVRELCLKDLKRIEEELKKPRDPGKEAPDPYWPLATLGEAALILGEWPEAEERYAQAVAVGRRHFGDLASSRRNARLLTARLDGDSERIEQCFRIPTVAVFTGHMVDRPDRPASKARFPARLEEAVRESLRDRLQKLNVGFGYTSIACGSDILFAETLLELGGEVRIVLPYEKNQFIEDSVDIIRGAEWKSRCEKLLEKVAGVAAPIVASDHRVFDNPVQYEYANFLLHGLAQARADQLGTTLIPLTVWDGKPGDGPGGTASTVERWRKSGLPVEIIHLDEILRCSCAELTTPEPAEAAAPAPGFSPLAEFAPDIRGLLFGDVEGFSKLTEDKVPLFMRHFLGLVGELIEKSPHAPEVKNTWGDGLYMVFKTVRDTGLFALELCRRTAEVDWEARGLGKLKLRIGVHAGPVHGCVDPVTLQYTYIGAHVSRAARIEPITPPGQVYASQPFAALAAADRVSEFACQYVGQVPMAKDYGTFPTYALRPR